MAGETYYFIFSTLLVLGASVHAANLLAIRLKGNALFGPRFKQNSPEYKRVAKLASNRNIVIVGIIEAFLLANLAYDIYRILQLQDQEYARALLIGAPILLVLLCAVIFFKIRNMFGDINSSKK